jgi:hypothetical protein
VSSSPAGPDSSVTHAIQEFLSKGWSVTSLGLPPDHPSGPSVSASEQVLYPTAVKIILKNFDATTDEELLDPEPSQEALGYESEDLEETFRQTVEACKG